MHDTATEDKLKHARENAKAWVSDISQMLERLDNDQPGAEDTIHQSPLEVSVRSGWGTPGEKMEPNEYKILLSTGGPALRIIGELDEHFEPETAVLEMQDWGIIWTPVPLSKDETHNLLRYASIFYYGE
jgi:hypothetical protein